MKIEFKNIEPVMLVFMLEIAGFILPIYFAYSCIPFKKFMLT